MSAPRWFHPSYCSPFTFWEAIQWRIGWQFEIWSNRLRERVIASAYRR